MKSKKTVLAAVLTLMLALSIVTVSATAASANVKKSGEPVNNPCIAAADVSGECAGRPLEGFIENLSFLSEQEKSKLLADLAEIEKYENQINEICSLMTDENAERLCAEIDAVDEKLTAVLERNAALWERVNDEYGCITEKNTSCIIQYTPMTIMTVQTALHIKPILRCRDLNIP